MKRRDLVKAMVTSPLLFGLRGWADDDKAKGKGQRTDKLHREDEATLEVRLHGPFAVILNKQERKITAYVPFDPDKQHEFQFYDPKLNAVATESHPGKFKNFQFVLRDDGLDLSHRPPYIDHGFDDFIFNVHGWKPQPDQYFVSVDLPFPEVITYVPPPVGVQFEDGKTGLMPMDHILEYRVAYPDRVVLQSKQLGNKKPLQCSELLKDFEAYWKESHDDPNLPMSEQKMLEQNLKQCAESKMGTYFFGVGLPADHRSEKDFSTTEKEHAKKFFNETLLRSIPQTKETDAKRIRMIGDYGPICSPPDRGAVHSSFLLPASQSYPAARLQTVAAIQDCRGGGLIGNCC
jgi:hypothetical protein